MKNGLLIGPKYATACEMIDTQAYSGWSTLKRPFKNKAIVQFDLNGINGPVSRGTFTPRDFLTPTPPRKPLPPGKTYPAPFFFCKNILGVKTRRDTGIFWKTPKNDFYGPCMKVNQYMETIK